MLTDTAFYQLLTPEPAGEGQFRAHSLPFDSPSIFGGQLMAQTLSAAAATLDHARPAHCLQANFIARGDPKQPLDFTVTRLRDGGLTSHRQVVLSQSSQPLLVASLSFQAEYSGFEHQADMPTVPTPEALQENPDNTLSLSDEGEEPFPFTLLQCPSPTGESSARSGVWGILAHPGPPTELLHQMLFAFFSDVSIMQSAMIPHALDWDDPSLVMATMNHTIWFQRKIDVGDWLLYDSESPSTTGGRALSVANAFDRQGALVATVAQEGVMRKRRSAA